MSDKVFIGSSVASLDYGEKKVISKVILTRSSDTWFVAGDDTGDTLEASNPWATQAMADAILAEIRGAPSYRPYTATDALVDPAVEIGDGVTVGGIYSEIVSMNIDLDIASCADLAAPGVDEVEEECPYKSSSNREAQRENKRIYSLITKTDQEIRLYVANEIDGLEADFSVTAEQIRAYVDNEIDGVESTFTQTASSLTAQISSIDGRVTSISADLDNVEIRVQGMEGNYTSLSVSVNGLEITTRGLEDIADGLSTGTTIISGYCVRTGKIAARYIEAEDIVASQLGGGLVALIDSSGRSVGSIFVASSSSAISGQGVQINAPALGLIATSGDIYAESRGGATYLHINTNNVRCKGSLVPTENGYWNLGGPSNKWANVYATNGTIQTSDRNQKTDIEYGLDRYDAMFDGLKPCTYRMKDGGVRTHVGLISQDVEENMAANNVSDMDFGGFIKSLREDGSYDYALRYGEFIPLLIAQAQKAKSRIANLEARVAILEGRL